MANPVLCAHSLLDADTLSSTPTADAAFPLSNLKDDRLFTLWKPGSAATTVDIVTDAGVGNTRTVDYFGLQNHDLSNVAGAGGAATLTFARSTDGVAYTTIFSVTPADNKIIFRTFTAETFRFFRLRMTRGTSMIPSIGELQWGSKVELPTGVLIGFDPQEERIDGRISQSQNGNFLGAISVFTMRRARIQLPLVADATLRSLTANTGFQYFWDNHAQLMKPFFFSWNPGNPGSFEKDAFFAAIDPQVPISRPTATPLASGFRDLAFEIWGVKE